MAGEALGQPEPIDDANEEMIELGLPPEVELSLLIQMVSDELDLQIMTDGDIGNDRVQLLLPGPIPRSSLRGLLESTLRMKGLALIEGDEPGWLRIAKAQDLVDIAPRISEGPDDAGDAPPSAVLTRVFELEHVDAQRANDVITPFLTEPGGNAMLIGEQRMLIVTDYASNVGRIEELIALVDRPGAAVEVRFRPILNLQAQQAADELQRILQAQQRAAGPPQGQVPGAGIEIVQQERTNQLVLIGPPEVIAAADELLGSIDVALGLETRIYSFRTASPERVTTLVETLIDDVSRERFFRSVVDEEHGLLIVTTTEAIHEQVAAIQRDLDREIEAAQPVVRYYKILNANADEVFATLAEMQGIGSSSLFAPRNSVPGRGGVNRRDAPDQARDPSQGETGVGESGVRADEPPPVWTDPTRPERRVDPRDRLRSEGEGEDNLGVAAGFETGDANIVMNTATSTLIITTTEDRQQYYADIIRQLDRRRPQVMIEVTLVALSVSDGQSIGVEVARFGDADDEPRVISFSSFGLNDSPGSSGGAAPALLNASLGFNGAIISEDIADIVIKALRTDGRTEVVSAPKILVNDNASGSLTSVTDAPFASINASNTVSSTSFGGFESAGTTINVTPQISEGDHLKLTYSIELSTFGEGGSDTTPPPRQRQQISSEITIPDGHTIIVGGLKRNDLTETVSRVPLLGEIPWVEYLFSSRSNNESDATLFVFIRPVILRDDAFEDLKYLSSRDLDQAGLPQDYPHSTPLLMTPGS